MNNQNSNKWDSQRKINNFRIKQTSMIVNFKVQQGTPEILTLMGIRETLYSQMMVIVSSLFWELVSKICLSARQDMATDKPISNDPP